MRLRALGTAGSLLVEHPVVIVVGDATNGLVCLEHSSTLSETIVDRIGCLAARGSSLRRIHELVTFPDEARKEVLARHVNHAVFAIGRELIGEDAIGPGDGEGPLELEIRLAMLDDNDGILK